MKMRKLTPEQTANMLIQDAKSIEIMMESERQTLETIKKRWPDAKITRLPGEIIIDIPRGKE